MESKDKIQDFLKRIRISNKSILIYTVDGCPACEELKSKLNFLDIKYNVSDMIKNPELWETIKSMGGGDYVPQVQVDDVLVYEYNDINELLSKIFSEVLGKKVVIK